MKTVIAGFIGVGPKDLDGEIALTFKKKVWYA
jgi:hypothetical protein